MHAFQGWTTHSMTLPMAVVYIWLCSKGVPQETLPGVTPDLTIMCTNQCRIMFSLSPAPASAHTGGCSCAWLVPPQSCISCEPMGAAQPSQAACHRPSLHACQWVLWPLQSNLNDPHQVDYPDS